MQNKLLQQAEIYAKRHRRRRTWRKIVRVMACIVVFCTTYALILPAITMERTQCGLEEHTHSESCYEQVTSQTVSSLSCTYELLNVHVHNQECYDSNGETICGFADYLVHAHGASCVDGAGILVCQIPEIEEHEHMDSCYAPEETEPAHVHEEVCYTSVRGELLCPLEESGGHAHSAECFTLGELVCHTVESEGHTHGEGCSETVQVCEATMDPHTHGEGCYVQLVCELPEDETHTHSDECSGMVLNCDLAEVPHTHVEGCWQTVQKCELPESEGHAHSDACYEVLLNCELDEEEGHLHTDACFEAVSELTCEIEEDTTGTAEETEPELICEKEVIRLHSHDDSECYESYLDGSGSEQKHLICEETVVLEHKHSEICLVTEEVPVDTESLTCTQEAAHVHAETCYDEAEVLICTESTEGHVHGAMCYGTWVLICGKEEHTHTEECLPEPVYYCGLEVHTHSEACVDEDGSTICALNEHVHVDECAQEVVVTYHCGYEAHAHTEDCSDEEGNLICTLPEHAHAEECTWELSEAERSEIAAVEALIEPLPGYDEIMAKLEEFYEADDTEGEEAYLTEVYAQVEEAYRAYMALDESLRGYVANADKLLELDFIWSRITLEATPEIVSSNSTWTGNLGGTPITNEVVYQFTNNAVVTMSGSIVIGNGGKLTILGSGSIVRAKDNNDQPLIVVLEGGELVIGDTSAENTSTQKDIFVVDGNDVVVDAATTTDVMSSAKRNGWGAAIYSMGKVTLVNTTVQNNKNRTTGTKAEKTVVSSCGGGLYITQTGSLSLDRCAINRNTAGAFGGGFYSQGPVTAKDTEISFNRAMTTEYGLNASNGGMINFGRGGGFELSTATSISTFDNVDIHHNVCMYYGGGGQVDNNAVLTMNSGSFRDNLALLHGAGGLHLTSDATFIMNGGSINGNTCYYVGGGIHTSYGTTLQLNGGEISNNVVYGRGGGIHIDCGSELLLDGTNIIGNRALTINPRPTSAEVDATGDNWSNIGYVGGNETKGIGGGVLVDCGTCTMSAGMVSGNYADHAGGGLGLVMIIVGSANNISYNEVASINLVGGTISDNKTGGNGAGIYLMRNAFGELSQEDLNLTTDEQKATYEALKAEIPFFTASGGTMRNNVAQQDGGGAYQDPNTKFTISGTALFEDNEAVRHGGGVYIDEGTAEISGGAMNRNTAGESGGALYIKGNVTMSNGNITNNTAKNAGGIYVAGGNVVMTNGRITGNSATENGGAVYVSNTSVTFGTNEGAIEVTNNVATNGAGFYLNQSGGAHTTTISNGQITDNTATGNGGGIYQTGIAAVCTIGGGGSVSRNKASNGGGFYIQSGTMNVNGGYVISNEAVGTSPNTTAFSSEMNTGVGGGIYLNSGNYTMTAATGDVGLYGNIAGFAADDVYAAPSGTQLTIPEVANMNLTNFGQAVGTVTDWFEDYATRDTNYSKGLKGGNYTDGSADVIRYRLADNAHKVANKITSATNKYICLTLGYEMDYSPITVKKVVTSYDGTFITDQKFDFAIEHNDGIHGIITTERSLSHNEVTTVTDVLRKSTITVTECNPGGYSVSVQVLDKDGNIIKSALGNTITVENQEGIQFVFTNHAGYELPDTGGAGTYLYTMGGMLLMMAAAILLYIHNLKRRKEERPSF